MSMLIFFVVVVSLFAGIALAALGVFLYFLYKSIKRLAEVAEAVHALVKPMGEGALLPDMLTSFKTASKTGKEIVAGLTAMTETVARLNQLLWQTQTADRSTIAVTAKPPGELNIHEQDSWFKAPTEVEQAHTELVQEAKAAGIPVDEEEMPGGEPPLNNMIGAEV